MTEEWSKMHILFVCQLGFCGTSGPYLSMSVWAQEDLLSSALSLYNQSNYPREENTEGRTTAVYESIHTLLTTLQHSSHPSRGISVWLLNFTPSYYSCPYVNRVCVRLNIPLHESSWYSSSVIQKERRALISIQHRRPGLLVSLIWNVIWFETLIARILSYIKGVMMVMVRCSTLWKSNSAAAYSCRVLGICCLIELALIHLSQTLSLQTVHKTTSAHI